jgi:hypothetical protein
MLWLVERLCDHHLDTGNSLGDSRVILDHLGRRNHDDSSGAFNIISGRAVFSDSLGLGLDVVLSRRVVPEGNRVGYSRVVGRTGERRGDGEKGCQDLGVELCRVSSRSVHVQRQTDR